MTFANLMIKLQRLWLLAILFLIPISLRYLTKEPFAISWLNVLSVGFIGIGGFNLAFGLLPYKPIKHRQFIWLLAIFSLAMVWALANTPVFRQGIGLMVSRFAQPLLVGFFAYQLVANQKIKIGECVHAIFWSIVPLLVLGGMQLIGSIDYRDPGRITGPYFYPNTAARYFEIILLLTLPWIVFSLKKYKIAYLGIWLVGVGLLLSTKSYNGVLSFGVGLAIMFSLLPKVYLSIKRVAISSLLVIALIAIFNVSKLPDWQTKINDSRLTRLEFWDVARGVISDHFWTGIGLKTWEKTYPELVEQYYIQKYQRLPLNWGSVQPHNVFLDALVKGGLPLLIAVAAVLLWPIITGINFAKSYYQRNPNWWFGLSAAGYGLAMLVFGLIDDPIWSDDTMPMLFILYFILACVSVAQSSTLKRAA